MELFKFQFLMKIHLPPAKAGGNATAGGKTTPSLTFLSAPTILTSSTIFDFFDYLTTSTEWLVTTPCESVY